MKRPLRKLLRTFFDHDPSFYDMYTDKTAQAGGQEYLDVITGHLHKQFGRARLNILDAGCQAGRLLIPLARLGHQVTGVDASGFSLRRAKQHAAKEGLSVTFRRSNISHIRRWVPPASMDAVMAAEVLYLCPDFKALLKLLNESVKPEGLLFISHRPPGYYVAKALEKGDVNMADSILSRHEGPSPEGRYHNWQTPAELLDIYNHCSLRTLACIPLDHQNIRAASGIPISDHVKEALEPFCIEKTLFRVPAYFLVTAQRPGL